jgi:hypothetical protein
VVFSDVTCDGGCKDVKEGLYQKGNPLEKGRKSGVGRSNQNANVSNRWFLDAERKAENNKHRDRNTQSQKGIRNIERAKAKEERKQILMRSVHTTTSIIILPLAPAKLLPPRQ